MNLYPAIDLKDGKCIRLAKGKLEKITFYNSNPLDQAKEFTKLGAKWICIFVKWGNMFTYRSCTR